MSIQKYSFAKISIPNGVRQIPVTALGAGATSVKFRLARNTSADLTIWPNASTTVSISIQVSYDNQQTWVNCGTATASGGPSPMPFCELGFSFQANPTHAKGTITVAGGPLVTSGNLSVN